MTNPEAQAQIDERKARLKALYDEVSKLESEVWALLAPTDEEDNEVTDSLLDQAHDCPEDVAEDLRYRIRELEALREMNAEEEETELAKTRIPADAKAEEEAS